MTDREAHLRPYQPTLHRLSRTLDKVKYPEEFKFPIHEKGFAKINAELKELKTNAGLVYNAAKEILKH
jgi:hypothetical protein